MPALGRCWSTISSSYSSGPGLEMVSQGRHPWGLTIPSQVLSLLGLFIRAPQVSCAVYPVSRETSAHSGGLSSTIE